MDDVASYAKAAAYFGAALAIGLGTIGPALAQGSVGSKACESISKCPEGADAIKGAMFAALIAIETSAIYALLIAAALIWAGK